MIVPIVPDSSSGEGNTTSSPPKQISPAKRWVFTLNNYSESVFSSICSKLHEKATLACIGKEVGECGTPHLQGYFELEWKARPISIFKDITTAIHFEKAKGDKMINLKYCSKDNLVFHFGFPKPIKVISEL